VNPVFSGIGHIALRVLDMPATLHFYCDVLGCKPAFEMKDREGNPWVVYIEVAAGQFVEFYHGGSRTDTMPHDAHTEVGMVHFCLVVDDVQAAAREIALRGGTVEGPPIQGVSKNWLFFIRDPDGNMIEIMQLHPDSPHLNYKEAN